MGHRYRDHLQAAVAGAAAPYGYTLTVWTSGAVTAHPRGIPSAADALLLLAGAVIGIYLLTIAVQFSIADAGDWPEQAPLDQDR